MSVERDSWGHGFAAEALTDVLCYLTEYESIKTVSAWCASDNIGSRKVMVKSGMKLVRSDKGSPENSERKSRMNIRKPLPGSWRRLYCKSCLMRGSPYLKGSLRIFHIMLVPKSEEGSTGL